MYNHNHKYALTVCLIAITLVSSCIAATVEPLPQHQQSVMQYSKRGTLDAQPMVKLAQTGLKGILGVTKHTVDGEFDILGRHKGGSDSDDEEDDDEDKRRGRGSRTSHHTGFGTDLNNKVKHRNQGKAKKAGTATASVAPAGKNDNHGKYGVKPMNDTTAKKLIKRNIADKKNYRRNVSSVSAPFNVQSPKTFSEHDDVMKNSMEPAIGRK
ncbi:hypothetical protein BDF20DRAFT_350242 [Mycotypha africana]|uniref:uncharacterized protein n=1 Tax=Mycotypha africana TaxID=64632 RepID=UPI00230075FA|nr:uncharacterized protein BDF20DRAFT_350242 [Mycotypha africana]KAI8966938.1 hypothetical protein BDF20DRAFT_350242 [Mycotypha africana]